jgi:hypothetical protein
MILMFCSGGYDLGLRRKKTPQNLCGGFKKVKW